MDRETVKCKCGFYSYRVYAKKRDPHGVVWDAYYDILDKDGRILRAENVVTTLDILTSEEEACRLAEVEARAKIHSAFGGTELATEL